VFVVKKLGMVGLLMMVASVQAAETVAPVEYREVAQTYSAEGLVEATQQSTVSAQIGGRVKEVLFDAGDWVNKGQVILRIDEREAVQAQAASGAQVMQAQANVQNARATYERSKQLFAQKFISQAGLDKAQVDYKVALAQAAASEAVAGQARLAHGYTSVIAPFSGVVSARLVELGEMVMPGKPLMSGFDPSEMRVVVSVPQEKIDEIGTKSETLVEIPSLTRWIKAASIRVQPIADARTHSTQVRVYLPANEKGLYPGMFVRVHFVVGKIKKLVIPVSAVLHRSEVVAVYVVDDQGVARLRQIRVGENVADGFVEILSGLKAGEKVASDPVKVGMQGVQANFW
jgi:RND family efflux transporter MFP subunit